MNKIKNIKQMAGGVFEVSFIHNQLHKYRSAAKQNICMIMSVCLKPLHIIGKVSVNASIRVLYKNQEICNK